MVATALVGSWKVVGFVMHTADGGTTQPYGEVPLGYGVFDGTTAFVQLCAEGESAAVAASFVAYFGPYTVEGSTIRIRVEGSNVPGYVGAVQVRVVAITADADGRDRLTIGVPGSYAATAVRVA